MMRLREQKHHTHAHTRARTPTTTRTATQLQLQSNLRNRICGFRALYPYYLFKVYIRWILCSLLAAIHLFFLFLYFADFPLVFFVECLILCLNYLIQPSIILFSEIASFFCLLVYQNWNDEHFRCNGSYFQFTLVLLKNT